MVYKTTSLIEMKPSQEGCVTEIEGGPKMTNKLEGLGIFPGANITKISSQWMRGPVLIKKGNTQIAVGYGMAKRIFVKISPYPDKQ